MKAFRAVLATLLANLACALIIWTLSADGWVNLGLSVDAAPANDGDPTAIPPAGGETDDSSSSSSADDASKPTAEESNGRSSPGRSRFWKDNIRMDANSKGERLSMEEILEMVRGGDAAGVKESHRSSKSKSSKSKSNHRNHHYYADRKSAVPPRPVTVHLPRYGKVEGRREASIDIFRGVPYAAPPVGQLRLAPPEPPTSWHPATLDASSFRADCWQVPDPVVNPRADVDHMSEDCLFVNIFTPAGQADRSKHGTRREKLLPVMVWLHGGAFTQGAGRRDEYDGRRLAEQGVVLVTLNYRLGALGFLVSSNDGLYGNLGLMDQRAALDWVHEEIACFGGDPDQVTLFGESAGAVMIGLHLTMEGAGTLFHRAIMQSNPLGYRFRSVVVANFIGDAFMKSVDCRDLACLRAERVEEILRAQSAVMGVPRSVGDFFPWAPTLTTESKVEIFFGRGTGSAVSRSKDHRLSRLEDGSFVSSVDWASRSLAEHRAKGSARWASVNVSQPLESLSKISDNIPIIIGTCKHEGEIFVHSAFPTAMTKTIYWMFVGALFRNSASRVLKHYRGLVEEVERKANELAALQIAEEEAKQKYQINKRKFDNIHDVIARRKADQLSERRNRRRLDKVVSTWNDGFDISGRRNELSLRHDKENSLSDNVDFRGWVTSQSIEGKDQCRRPRKERRQLIRMERVSLREYERQERRAARLRAKRLREAAKVQIDYRPVLSHLLNDYLFRCPSWHYAQLLSERREKRRRHENNIFVYRFSQPTHVPSYPECWGKSCHTTELPYVFASMNVIQSNYSTLSAYAQKEAPHIQDYPYLELLEKLEVSHINATTGSEEDLYNLPGRNHSKAFRRAIRHFFGQYYLGVDTDLELATDMVQRWVAFATNGRPNFDDGGRSALWRPWRYRPSRMIGGDEAEAARHPYARSIEDFWPDNEWDDDDDEGDDVLSSSSDVEDALEDDGPFTQFDADAESRHHVARQRYYRRRALAALQLEESSQDDPFRTELKRVHPTVHGDDEVEKTLVMKLFPWLRHEVSTPSLMSRTVSRDLVQKAIDLGALGSGLSRSNADRSRTKDFLPELIDLKWPPESILVESDCSCDLWSEISYRY